MDHAYNLNIRFMKWLVGKNCLDDFDALKQVLLLERFFETLPEAIKLWLVDKQPATLDEAARIADLYALITRLMQKVR